MRIPGFSVIASAVLVAALFHAYIFWYSYRMPGETETTTSMIRAPDFSLADQHGRPVTLSDYLGRKVVLVSSGAVGAGMGRLELGGLAEGKWRHLSDKEKQILLSALRETGGD